MPGAFGSIWTGKVEIFLKPMKIDRRGIERRGYRQGEYSLTLDADKVIELLVGNDLYSSQLVFVRELLQNSLDAVSSRKIVDYRFKEACSQDIEKAAIRITTWTDKDEYRWFRIDDNGIGMTEDVISQYFLKIGKSYYRSDEFRKDLYDNHTIDFEPISQFGIGILSCFLGGERIEVSTRHWDRSKDYPGLNKGAGIRFSMCGTKGYYSIANEAKGDKGSTMPGINKNDEASFRMEPGTSIAVRLKKDTWDEYEDMEAVVKQYLGLPEIPVYFDNGMDKLRFPTFEEFMTATKNVGNRNVPLPEEEKKKIAKFAEENDIELNLDFNFNTLFFDSVFKSPYINGVRISPEISCTLGGFNEYEVQNLQIYRRINVDTTAVENEFRIAIYLYYEYFGMHGDYTGDRIQRLKDLWEQEKKWK